MFHGGKRQFRDTKSMYFQLKYSCSASEKKRDKNTFCFKFKAVSMDTTLLLCDRECRKHVACVRFSLVHAYYDLYSVKHPSIILNAQIHVCFSISIQLKMPWHRVLDKERRSHTENTFFRDIERFLNVVLPVIESLH